ncbi:MAG: hypothetical protein ACI89X_003807 [Planctomycetota bacterium]
MNLPVALDPFGVQACSLLQGADLTLTAATVPSGVDSAVFVLAVPSNLALLGYPLFLHSWTIQPLSNTAGIVLSDGFALTVGNV